MSDHNHVPYAKKKTGVPKESVSAEAAVLQKLLPEYVSLYRIEANSGEYEILRLEGNTNAVELVKESWHPYEDFDEYTSQYARRFILPEEQKEFKDWFLCRNIDSILYKEKQVQEELERALDEARISSEIISASRIRDVFTGKRYEQNML